MTTKQLLLWASLAHKFYDIERLDMKECLYQVKQESPSIKDMEWNRIDLEVTVAICAQYSLDTIEEMLHHITVNTED